MKLLFAFLLFIIAVNFSMGQNLVPTDKKTIIRYCDSFMINYCKGKYSESILSLKSYSNIDTQQLDSMAIGSEEQMNGVIRSFGNIQSYVFVKEKNVVEVLIERLYLIKFEKSCMKFSFAIYNNGKSWAILAFHLNYDIEDLF